MGVAIVAASCSSSWLRAALAWSTRAEQAAERDANGDAAVEPRADPAMLPATESTGRARPRPNRWAEGAPQRSWRLPRHRAAQEEGGGPLRCRPERAQDHPTGREDSCPGAGVSTPTEQPQTTESAGPGLEKQQASPPLDLASLENRLKQTRAIGALSKLALKNQIDDLLNLFRAITQGAGRRLSPSSGNV